MRLIENGFGITNEILKMVNEAKEFLYLISPFIQFEKEGTDGLSLVKQSIIEARNRNVDVWILIRPIKNPIRQNQLNKFIDSGCLVKLLPNLSSKVYINESNVIITSMNLYFTSIMRNEEIGLLLNREAERQIYFQILKYIKGLSRKSFDKSKINQILSSLPEADERKLEKLQKGKISLDKEFIYVLKLENNKWWIGKSKNPSSRINKHISGMGSAWTRDNKVIKTEEVLEDAVLTEITLKYMKEYGWENIRGTCFNNMPDQYIPKSIKDYIYNLGGDFNKTFQSDNNKITKENIFDFTEDSYDFKAQYQDTDEKYLVYILRLENGKWWIGKTTNIKTKIREIRNGEGPPWTFINRLIKLEELRENADLKEVTLEYMRKYGWENVRGYAWSQWNMKNPPKEL